MGDLERLLGPLRFGALYLGAGGAATGAQCLFEFYNWAGGGGGSSVGGGGETLVRTLGSSGAVCSIIGCCVALNPQGKFFLYMLIPVRLWQLGLMCLAFDVILPIYCHQWDKALSWMLSSASSSDIKDSEQKVDRRVAHVSHVTGGIW